MIYMMLFVVVAVVVGRYKWKSPIRMMALCFLVCKNGLKSKKKSEGCAHYPRWGRG